MTKLVVAFRNFAKAPKNQSMNVLRETISIILRTTKKTNNSLCVCVCVCVLVCVCVECGIFNVKLGGTFSSH